ncbi:hypothetical protein JW898_00375 [Candidatus Woesearchaeota archaeon]|nr:hypothetical protein [Candidatus Woesearchaeota archaeon]
MTNTSIDDKFSEGRSRNIAAAIAITAAIAAGGTAAEAYASEREPAPKLYINKSPNHYSMQKSRSAGENDLRELVNTGDVEEAWVYVKYRNGPEIWHETGINETQGDCTMDLDGQRLFRDKEMIENVTLYHFHPEDLGGRRNFIDSETPSYKDIQGNMKVTCWIRNMYPQLLNKTDFRVVVGSGTYIIRFNPKALDNKIMWNMGAKKTAELDETRTTSGIVDTGLDYGIWNRKNFARENRKFAQRFSNPLYSIGFTEWTAKEPAPEPAKAKYADDFRQSVRELRKKAKNLDTRLDKVHNAIDKVQRRMHHRHRK